LAHPEQDSSKKFVRSAECGKIMSDSSETTRTKKERFWLEHKIVKCRKEHECAACDNPISKGERAFVESGKTEDSGFINCYFHTDEENKCYDDFLSACQPNNTVEILRKIKDSSFFGQIDYSSWKKEVCV